MALSYKVKLSWEEFWDNQRSNPNCELAFKYNSATYILLHKDYVWEIAEYNDKNGSVGKVLVAFCEENKDGADYKKDAIWNDCIQQCYNCLTAPVFSDKSFKDIINNVQFED